MSLYIIEDRYGALRDSSVNYNYAKSLQQSRYPDCHIVELVPAKPKVKVSQEEADMLEKAKHNPTLWPSFMITEYSNSHKGNILGNDLEDRLMSAYVIGWTVAKPKRWNVKVPHAEKTLYRKHDSGVLFASIYVGPQNHANDFLFTDAEIEHYGLQDCERVEVTDDEQ